MRWKTILAILSLSSVIGCGLDDTDIIGKTPEEKFRFVAKRSPDFAFGLGYARGDGLPKLMVTGMTKIGGKTPVPMNAKWHVGSISKSFTASLIMRLVDRGFVKLDEPIGTYLIGFKDQMHPQWKAATLRQLLSHTSGAQANIGHRELIASLEYESYVGRRKVMSSVWNKPMTGKPGEFEYSNVGFVVAAMVAEELTHATWESLIQNEIARPLGLKSIGFGAPTGDDDPRGHITTFGRDRAVDPTGDQADNPAWMGPAGTLHMTLEDLVKWGQAHVLACQGKLPQFLSEESCKTLQNPVTSDYGMGWALDPSVPNPPAVWHNGSNLRWYASLYLNMQNGTTVAAVTNSAADETPDALAKAVSRDF